ncbi:MAG: rod shape-determining protein MreD [Kiritimatiellae bacterium]|nr:rod shape-determining protein MreD [Kiritimatiellia bacterium]
MSTAGALLLLFAGGVLQAVMPAPAMAGQTPIPLLVALVVHYALTRRRPFALAVAVAAGLVQDALGLVPLGVSSAAFAVVALLAGRYREEVFEFRTATHVAIGAIAAPAATLLTALLLAALGQLSVGSLQVLLKLAGAAVLGAFVTPVVAESAARFERHIGASPEGRR